MATAASFDTLAQNLLRNGPHKLEHTPRRVRALFDSVFLFDTTAAVYVWEHEYYPQFYIPAVDFNPGVLTKKGLVEGTEREDTKAYWATVQGRKDGREIEKVLLFEGGKLGGLVRIQFGAIDQWFEEEQPIDVHPKDPYKRIDILPSARKITVKVDDVVVAESAANNMFLYETLLRPRYYLPKTSLRWQYISASPTVTKCPYKGTASYYNIAVNGRLYKDLVWWYPHTTIESGLVAGLVCFFNEKVDLYVDDVKEKK